MSELDEIESRAVDVNGLLLRIKDLLRQGNVERSEALVEEAQRLNWRNRQELLAAGAADSIRADTARVKAGYDLGALAGAPPAVVEE